MATKNEMNEKFFTKEGLKAIENRIKSWIDVFNNKKFPIKSMILGFGEFEIKNKEECLSRIKELCELIGFQCKYIKKDFGDKLEEKIEY